MVKCQGKKGDGICGFELPEEFQFCPICTTPVQKDKEPPDEITINCPGKKKNGDVCQAPVKKGQKFCKKCGWRVNSKIFKAGSRVCYAKLENDKDCLNVLSSDDEFCEECGNESTNTAKTEENSGEENKDQGYTASAANKDKTVQEEETYVKDKKATEQIKKQTTEQISIQPQQNVKNQSQNKNEYTEMTDSKNNNESAETTENHNKDDDLETANDYCIDGSSKESEDNISGQNKDTIKVEQKKTGITESTSGSGTKQTLNFDNQQNARQLSNNEDKNENVLQPVEPSGNAQSQTTAYVQQDIMCDSSIDKTSNQQNTNNVEVQHQSDTDLDQNSSEITLQESEQGQSKEKDKSLPLSPSQGPNESGVLSQQDIHKEAEMDIDNTEPTVTNMSVAGAANLTGAGIFTTTSNTNDVSNNECMKANIPENTPSEQNNNTTEAHTKDTNKNKTGVENLEENEEDSSGDETGSSDGDHAVNEDPKSSQTETGSGKKQKKKTKSSSRSKEQKKRKRLKKQEKERKKHEKHASTTGLTDENETHSSKKTSNKVP
ncbi:hypothetical protein KUTeg_007052 [Tegillarca granosa]|uniref:Uncharacterized protein n=1 Tax=Tegillarca granosa TaxID=220873 RepID=A0ABQ9FC48_TEGGR|nr:hypothetical protein KUTeg_007052 [Tegillarca granosa]